MNINDKVNAENKALADTIVRATVTDWAGNELFSSEDYYKALDYYFSLTDTLDNNQLDNIFLNSYDENGTNHGIFY